MRRWAASLDFELPAWGRERMAWRRASGSGDAAMEVAPLGFATAAVGVGVALRQAGWPDGPSLLFSAAEWRAFLAGVRGGEFDDLTDSGGGDAR
ncbi:hypothetical protein CC117_32445 [Parafrankia colletiae]|uniref:DUF397 domain-containing protein n=2 Tax=Parafrankia colletiae TaxID=573497 RepID=A0A1S1RDR2_9ACTN|nr:DUF397 domain-containing protein [Frankia sp. Cpl3]OHV43891.1 hypothetical protein CC117_32445 [Parafrankia colletiae]